MPASYAARALHMIKPVAWLTCRFAVSSLVYGAQTGRLSSSGVASSAAVRGCGSQACGLVAATSEKRAHSSVILARCSSRLNPRRRRIAVSISA